MEPNVWSGLSAAVENDGIPKLSNANVLKDLTGMEELVCFVLLAKYGTMLQKVVFAQQALSGITNSVLLLRLAVEG